MSSLIDLFSQMFFLQFESLGLSLPLSFKEDYPGEGLFFRRVDDKLTIYYLFSSDQIIFPKEVVNLLRAVNRELLERQVPDLENTNIDNFLYYGSLLINSMDGAYLENVGDVLDMVLKVGSKDLRDYLKTKFDYSLNPIILRNIKKTVEI